jgi:hypothetical protein
MRNILAFIGALVVTLVAVGWYENWFQFRTTPGADGKRNISIDIDSAKVGDDIHKTTGNIEEFLKERAKEAKATAPATTPAKDATPGVNLTQPSQDPKFELNLFGPTNKQ